jgi:pSer/pThr/pTyr-binding forkhead associated (FHA) protein
LIYYIIIPDNIYSLEGYFGGSKMKKNDSDKLICTNGAELVGMETISDESGPGFFQKPPGYNLPVLTKFLSNTCGKPVIIRKSRIVLGRLPICDISFDDMKISRQHAFMEYKNIAYPTQLPFCVLSDNNSRNGIYVNGDRITEPYNMRNGDRIYLGDSILEYNIRSELEIEYDSKVKSMMQEKGFKSTKTVLKQKINVGLQIMFPEETFTPRPIEGYVESVSIDGVKVNVPDLPQRLYDKMIKTTRYAKVIFFIDEPDKRASVHCRISWLIYKGKEKSNACTLGLALDELLPKERQFISSLVN